MRQTPTLSERLEPPFPVCKQAVADTCLRLISHKRFTRATLLFAAALPPAVTMDLEEEVLVLAM
jgi:hypothetical protein